MYLRITAKVEQIDILQKLMAISTIETRVNGTASLVVGTRVYQAAPLLEVCATDGHMRIRPATFSYTEHEPDPPGLWTTDHLFPAWEVRLELADSELVVAEINIATK